MNRKETPQGPIRDQLDAQISGANEHRISPSEREKIRRFVDATRRSFLISMNGGPIGDQPSPVELRWQVKGQSRVATVTALTEQRPDGRIDLLLRDCPDDLHFLALLAGKFEIPDFPTLEIAIDDRNIELVSQESGQQKLADEPTFSLGADSGDEADDIPIDPTSGPSLSISWPRGERPKVLLAAGPNQGPYFGVLESEWNSSIKPGETSGLAIQEYVGHGQWSGQTEQIRPIDATVVSVCVRPLEMCELGLLDSVATGDALSDLTEFLAVQDFEAYTASHDEDVIRVQGLPEDTFDSDRIVALKGLSVAVPFEHQSFESWWSKLAPRIERQLRRRIRNDSVLKTHMLDDLLYDVAYVIAKEQHYLKEIYQLDGKDRLDGYIYTITQNMANGLFRKLTGKLKGPARNEVSFETFGPQDNEAFSMGDMFKDPHNPISELVDRDLLLECLKFLTTEERDILSERASGTSRKELAAKFFGEPAPGEKRKGEGAIGHRERTAKKKLKRAYEVRLASCDGSFTVSDIVTDRELQAVLSGCGENCNLTKKEIDAADAKLELIRASWAISQSRVLADCEESAVEALLAVGNRSRDPLTTLFDSFPVDRLHRLCCELHAWILIHRFDYEKHGLQEPGKTYLHERVLKGRDWPTTLRRLRECKKCLATAKNPVDPLKIPNKVKSIWNKNSSLVPKEFRQFDFADARI